ncbi:Hsp20/alpha crystallin family protein [Desulfoscipio gibsoniae]|uniref:Molecular chaperone (Small heat shock protein) n=1 Tax=Desulfoscipio gibsoniae DSM 7213 TaxID=767817 RepID=R4KIB5_9FIRM|nr:Hsp20/alpha crystallin family protein [Desulfoscipio gibsoniae]AGL02359.1 molecular chaperone (small heat shock protein) [Desulfoscipio gibsoniae DSM 7213]
MGDKHDPFEVLKHFPQFDENFLRDLASSGWNNPVDVLKNLGRGKWPPVDIVETLNEIIITVDIPGLKRTDDVRVEVRGNNLTLNGDKVTDTGTLSNSRIHRQERQYGRFSRTISLPVAVNGKYGRATYRQGVMEIRFSKLSDDQAETLKVNFYE